MYTNKSTSFLSNVPPHKLNTRFCFSECHSHCFLLLQVLLKKKYIRFETHFCLNEVRIYTFIFSAERMGSDLYTRPSSGKTIHRYALRGGGKLLKFKSKSKAAYLELNATPTKGAVSRFGSHNFKTPLFVKGRNGEHGHHE